MRRAINSWAVLLSAALLTVSASHAKAATTLGQTFAPGACTTVQTWLQGVDPSAGPSYHVPSAGVITSWSYQAASGVTTEQLKFKVGRLQSGTNYLIKGESGLETIAPNVLNTFPTRIAVAAGDTIGYYNPNGLPCLAAAAGAIVQLTNGDKLPGNTSVYASGSGSKLDLSAQLEPDADGDEFGDETQDACPTNASTQGACSAAPKDTDPPDTKITKGPRAKDDEDKVKFKFTSDEPGSTFECKLTGPGLKPAFKKLSPCTSPKTYKNLDEGKYTFSVEATDNVANSDPTLAVRKFKIIGEA